jgi:hypothetical protein
VLSFVTTTPIIEKVKILFFNWKVDFSHQKMKILPAFCLLSAAAMANVAALTINTAEARFYKTFFFVADGETQEAGVFVLPCFCLG